MSDVMEADASKILEERIGLSGYVINVTNKIRKLSADVGGSIKAM
jgi:hypothetical protein